MFRACDQCRARKVKCLPEGLACKPCQFRKICCTTKDPIQKRGPKLRNPSLAPIFSVCFRNATSPYSDSMSPSPSSLDEDLISYFLCHHNQQFGDILDNQMLLRFRSKSPSLTETLLFFSICSVSAVVSMLGLQNPATAYYLSQTTSLLGMPTVYRDDLYYKSLLIVEFLQDHIEHQTNLLK
ncbi:hypothetical protein DSO57_1025092 [Entomophthora muscae]|uniref:Uncharacterized protein n=1 Tax=Entomophthora muscae TaxID=34485 RepID=A0ACC2SRD3_9FUNG|nr:hypothetical protein DSO57_1025092 [Entomophthora muscae]